MRAASTAWEDTLSLVVAAELMLVLAGTVLLVGWLLAGVVQVRAAVPHASVRSCVSAGPQVLLGRERGWPGAGRTIAPPALTGASLRVSGRLLTPVAVIAAVVLSAAAVALGGPDSGTAVPVAVTAAALVLGGSGAVLRRVRGDRGQAAEEWLATRGAHLTLGTLTADLLLAGSVVLAVSVLTPGPVAPLGLLGVAGAALVARLLTVLSRPPAGLLVADPLLGLALVVAGVPVAPALVVVVLWRLAFTLAVLAAVLTQRAARPALAVLTLSDEPTGSAGGELAHRLLFRTISALPPRLAAPLRARIFDSMFAGGQDPWRHEELAYENRKRDRLVAQVPDGVRTIVELGCAGGHNLAALAAAHPEARVVGLDLSRQAVAAARRRTEGQPSVTVLHTDARGGGAVLAREGIDRVDALVVAEVLYYIGEPGRIRAELAGLRDLLPRGAAVVLLHPRSDAHRLHPPAVDVLGCDPGRTVAVPDPVRPYVLQLAVRR